MKRVDEGWFETRDIEGTRYRHVSKFLRAEFVVPLDFVTARWRWWSRRQKGTFAAAFAARVKLVEGDREILDFLMENGNTDAWALVAQLIAREYPDRHRALEFLLERVTEGAPLLANYYQALDILGASECVQELKAALARHRRYVDRHPSLKWWKMWKDRLAYMDYLSCSATLFKLTGEEQYRTNLKLMLGHRDEPVRQMAQTAAMSSGITI